MIEIRLIFPMKADAHKANAEICKFFQGSKLFIENNIIVTPVKKDTDKKNRPFWYFFIDISQSKDDINIEKYIEITGGLLDIVNQGKNVWAFA